MFKIELASTSQHRTHLKQLVRELVPLSKKNVNFTPNTMGDPSGESCDITGKGKKNGSLILAKMCL